VHLNLPFEEPLHIGAAALADLAGEGVDSASGWSPSTTATSPASPFGVSLTASPAGASAPAGPTDPAGSVAAASPLPLLDPQQPGVVVAGPWRGSPQAWDDHLEALILWQRRTGWPVLADPLSGLRGQGRLTWVGGYDLLLESPDPALVPAQVLRLGSLPASRRLERWLGALAADQVLVSEGDPRPLDPLAVVRAQTEVGLAAWVRAHPPVDQEEPCLGSLRLGGAWWEAERRLQALLDQELGAAMPPEGQAVIGGEVSAARAWSEPSLARQLNRLLPAGLPLMLANSSPVRDWESFADPCAAARPVYGFRGASGIDGTLSEACGLAEALGACLLVSGDLALLHDANGWLWRPQLRGRLTVLLIDNGGGGIFEQLPIRTPRSDLLDFERLFAMPQPLDPLALAQAHGVPCRRLDTPASLGADLAWALEHPFSLLVARTDRRRDAALRQRLRTMAATDASP
jgi:2-succinyl-5-enolpyruvyl-6-hydroxy-3-cyclohexene-1-carboxylate synthase